MSYMVRIRTRCKCFRLCEDDPVRVFPEFNFGGVDPSTEYLFPLMQACDCTNEDCELFGVGCGRCGRHVTVSCFRV